MIGVVVSIAYDSSLRPHPEKGHVLLRPSGKLKPADLSRELKGVSERLVCLALWALCQKEMIFRDQILQME
jgi:hypothetical protein